MNIFVNALFFVVVVFLVSHRFHPYLLGRVLRDKNGAPQTSPGGDGSGFLGDLLKDNVPLGSDSSSTYSLVSIIMTVIITCVLLGACLYVILSQDYGEAKQEWASGMVGALLGYWFRKPKA